MKYKFYNQKTAKCTEWKHYDDKLTPFALAKEYGYEYFTGIICELYFFTDCDGKELVIDISKEN